MAVPQGSRRRAIVETSAGGVVFRWTEDGPRVLLIRDAYGHWGLPKGHLEADETAEAAALREVQEETGLGGLRLGTRLSTIDWYFRSTRGIVHKFCHFYLIEAPVGEAVPQSDEGITECCWLPIEEAAARISYRNAREVVEAAAVALGATRAEG